MIKKKVLMSLVSAFLSVSSVTAMSANAIPYAFHSTYSEEYQEIMEGYTEFDDCGYFDACSNSDLHGYDRSYADDIHIMLQKDIGNRISFDVVADENEKEEIDACFDVLDDSYEIESDYIEYVDGSLSYWHYVIIDKACRHETVYNAKMICDSLKEKFDVKAFNYYDDVKTLKVFTAASLNTEQLLHFEYSEWMNQNALDKLSNYVNENALDFDVVDNHAFESEFTKMCSLISANAMTIDEQMAMAKEIKDNVDLEISFDIPESLRQEAVPNSIDIYNAVDGDFNNDGELSMSDAVAILQCIGNPDEYTMTAQGKFNADINNCGNGITGLDAVEIMKRLAETE